MRALAICAIVAACGLVVAVVFLAADSPARLVECDQQLSKYVQRSAVLKSALEQMLSAIEDLRLGPPASHPDKIRKYMVIRQHALAGLGTAGYVCEWKMDAAMRLDAQPTRLECRDAE